MKIAEVPEASPSKKLRLCGTNLMSLTEYQVKKHLLGSKHKRSTASDGTNTLKAFFSTSSLSKPSGSAVAKSKQKKELDKGAGTFQETMDQGEVTDSEQGGEDGKVKDYFCEEGLGRK